MEVMTYGHIAQHVLVGSALSLLIVIPLSVHAGFLSALFDTAKAEEFTAVSATLENNAQMVPLLKAITHADPNPAKGGGDIIVEEGALVPYRDTSERELRAQSKSGNGEINVYVVREGDTLSQIADMFDVSAKTILWANDIADPTKIRPGDTLVILPITGVRHVVKSGDTIGSIAKKYSGDVDDILAYNQLTSADSIQVGDTLIIPDGTISAPAASRSVAPVRTSGGSAVAQGNGSAGFSHPLPGSVRTQGIHGYNGVDLAAPAGTAVRAAAAGQVIVSRSSGWNGGYGNYVVIKHPNGTQTLYAHLSSNAVVTGDTVVAGEVIGGVGSTGRSTGNHLHFEVRGARNPF